MFFKHNFFEIDIKGGDIRIKLLVDKNLDDTKFEKQIDSIINRDTKRIWNYVKPALYILKFFTISISDCNISLDICIKEKVLTSLLITDIKLSITGEEEKDTYILSIYNESDKPIVIKKKDDYTNYLKLNQFTIQIKYGYKDKNIYLIPKYVVFDINEIKVQIVPLYTHFIKIIYKTYV